ncbi:response regulator [Mitsuaria sp. GD03876]|uniref:response regulator n=1 Tax=Mitsuaria sp. GD03876 TaxID=2975399 RepID=UPI00244BAEE5|nr:response regulator [Mitsuaria sp. GD03876]MDH0866960.1 response regulator [Mitsuaria sp. GD03876]
MPRHVVIVDDNLESSETLGILLELEGYSTATAASLGEARLRLAERRPDVLILDRVLPDGQGMDFVTEALKGGPMTIVMLTGMSAPEDAVEAIRRGATAYLVKPATIDQLNAVLDAQPRKDDRLSRYGGGVFAA